MTKRACYSLGANARLAALKAFAVETHVERIQNIYQQLLAQTKR
jgi:hypothetical protein